jgi:hypothetical protein
VSAAAVEPPAKRSTVFEGSHVAAACLRGWAATVAGEGNGPPEEGWQDDLAADLRGAAAVLQPELAGPEGVTPRQAATVAIRRELDEMTILSEPAKRALAGRLARVAVDAAEAVRASVPAPIRPPATDDLGCTDPDCDCAK